VKGKLYPQFITPVGSMFRECTFSILCDEGNNTDHKYFAILVQLWVERVCMPSIRFLDMRICKLLMLQVFFYVIDEALIKRNPWSNVVGFESDTCNVMIGLLNKIYKLIPMLN